jgi:hypothetical protein
MKRNLLIRTVDADTWAESGGTAGPFGYLFRQRLLKIVPVPANGCRIVPKVFCERKY